MSKNIKIWFDSEADFLEVTFSNAPGYVQETDNDAILKKVDQDGNIIGFSILNLSQLSKEKSLLIELDSFTAL